MTDTSFMTEDRIYVVQTQLISGSEVEEIIFKIRFNACKVVENEYDK